MADTVELMRKRVLDMAFRGELVTQRSEEGTAEELLSQVYNTGNFNTGAIDDPPFEIPKSWEWVRHNHLFEIIGGSQPPKSNFVSEYREGYVQLYQIRDYGKNPQPVYVPRDKVTKFTEKNDILLARYGASVGKVFLAEKGAYNVAMAKVTPLFDNTKLANTLYMYYFYHSHLYQNLVLGISRSAQAGFNKGDLDALFIPFPPLEEQKRIVAKIEEIFAVIDQIGTKKEEALTIIRNMRQTAFQDAIMGVLVDQEDTDEPASILYEKIQAEKEKLVKKKKIKKDKLLPDIEVDEIPFDIPESWKWVRLKEVVHNHGQKKPDKPFSYIDIGSIDNNRTQLNKEEKIVKPEEAPSRARKIVKFGDILYSTVRPYLHNACIVDREFSEEPIASTGFAVMRTFNGLLNRFLFYYLLSPTFDLYANDSSNATGTAYPAINDTKLYKAVVPLPPLVEQERIVEKLDEIMAICDQMEAIFDGTSETNNVLKVAE